MTEHVHDYRIPLDYCLCGESAEQGVKRMATRRSLIWGTPLHSRLITLFPSTYGTGPTVSRWSLLPQQSLRQMAAFLAGDHR